MDNAYKSLFFSISVNKQNFIFPEEIFTIFKLLIFIVLRSIDSGEKTSTWYLLHQYTKYSQFREKSFFFGIITNVFMWNYSKMSSSKYQIHILTIILLLTNRFFFFFIFFFLFNVIENARIISFYLLFVHLSNRTYKSEWKYSRESNINTQFTQFRISTQFTLNHSVIVDFSF